MQERPQLKWVTVSLSASSPLQNISVNLLSLNTICLKGSGNLSSWPHILKQVTETSMPLKHTSIHCGTRLSRLVCPASTSVLQHNAMLRLCTTQWSLACSPVMEHRTVRGLPLLWIMHLYHAVALPPTLLHSWLIVVMLLPIAVALLRQPIGAYYCQTSVLPQQTKVEWIKSLRLPM